MRLQFIFWGAVGTHQMILFYRVYFVWNTGQYICEHPGLLECLILQRHWESSPPSVKSIISVRINNWFGKNRQTAAATHNIPFCLLWRYWSRSSWSLSPNYPTKAMKVCYGQCTVYYWQHLLLLVIRDAYAHIALPTVELIYIPLFIGGWKLACHVFAIY